MRRMASSARVSRLSASCDYDKKFKPSRTFLFDLIECKSKYSVSIAKITRSKIAQKNIRILAITIKLSFICKLLVNIAST